MSGAQTQVLGFAEALDLVLRHAAQVVRLPGSERVALLACAGRVLAEEVLADRDQPPFDRATRDGFAVRAEDSPPAGGCAPQARCVPVRRGSVESWRPGPRLRS